MNKKLILAVRIIVPLLITLSMGTLVYILHAFRRMSFDIYVMLVYTLLVYLIFYIDRKVIHFLYRRYPQKNSIWHRFVLPLVLSFTLSDLIIFLFYTPFKLYQIAQGANDSFHWIYVLTVSLQVLFLVLAANAINQVIFLMQRWQEEALRAEQLEREKTEAVLTSLKHQISPHFLFNNFNTLYSLIEEKSEKAGDFLLKLSALYRTILQNQEEVIPVAEELQAFQDYLFLLKTRFHEDIQMEYQLDQRDLDHYYLPPLSLQTLLENAIKHSHFDEDHPLRLKLEQQGEWITLTNSIYTAKTEMLPSYGIGLENIRSRYQLLSDRKVVIEQTEACFAVSLPLLSLEKQSL
ncbi:MAG: histidine kinase [Saprospiraceae bacterium]|nr:histidine kinase [Saprospiraceae bacterium]